MMIRLHRAALDTVLQGLAFQVLHDDEGLSFMLTNVVDGADVGMVQCRRCSGFPLEPLQCLLVLGVFLRQKLQGHIATQAGVLSPVHHTHAPFTDLLQNLVMADGRADHDPPQAVDRFVLNVTT